jgi:hypothetical protein
MYDVTNWQFRKGARYKLHVGTVEINYIGGRSDSDATQEGYEWLDYKYFMPGYMLTLACPPIEQGTEVVWNAERNEVEDGQFYQGGSWTDYDDPLAEAPRDRIVRWRSAAGQPLGAGYVLSATYRPLDCHQDVTVTRTLETRALDPSNEDHRDEFNEDCDMLQRAMIQVFYLDKGRLDSYRRGKYDRNAQGYYHSSVVTRLVRHWSAIADEVWNFDKFTLGSGDPQYVLSTQVVAGIWSQFNLILAAPLPNAVDNTHPQYSTWRTNARNAAGFVVPAGLGKTPEDVLDAIFQEEGPATHVPTHSYAPHTPLAVSSVKIGENATDHTWTDGGIGFGSIQPYNRGGRNIYDPYQNVLRVAEILVDHQGNLPAAVTGPRAKVWHVVLAYHRGSLLTPSTPDQIRQTHPEPAGYADRVFGYMQVAIPHSNGD